MSSSFIHACGHRYRGLVCSDCGKPAQRKHVQHNRLCEQCGAEFITWSTNKMVCDDCRDQGRRERRAQGIRVSAPHHGTPTVSPCEHCGFLQECRHNIRETWFTPYCFAESRYHFAWLKETRAKGGQIGKLLLVITLLTLLTLSTFIPTPANAETNTVYLPVAFADVKLFVQDLQRLVRDGFPTYEWEFAEWCQDLECEQVNNILPELSRYAPAGYVVPFVRIFIRDFTPGGANVLYPWDGCFVGVCTMGIGASIESGNATGAHIYLDTGDPAYWQGTVEVVDICLELEGIDFKHVCDNNMELAENANNYYAERINREED